MLYKNKKIVKWLVFILVTYFVSWTLAYAFFLQGDFSFFLQYLYYSWVGAGEIAAFVQWTALILTLLSVTVAVVFKLCWIKNLKKKKSRLIFVCYGIGVIALFSFIGFYLSSETHGNVPTLVKWIGMPGDLLAAFCLVGVHSDYFDLVSILANIAVYLLIPFLFWKIASTRKKEEK